MRRNHPDNPDTWLELGGVDMKFHDPEEAFQGAIDDGYLSDKPGSEAYAGEYMYMGTVDATTAERAAEPWALHRDLFKHRISRKYLRVPVTWIS